MIRQHVVTIVLGLLAGLVGSQLLGRPAPPKTEASVMDRREPPPIVVPPGWDPHTLSRIAQLEQRVEGLTVDAAGEAVDPANETSTPAPRTSKEEERAALYELELEQQEALLLEHDEEPLDEHWSFEQVATMQHTLDPMVERGMTAVKNLDCRAKTCLVQLTFPTPGDALAYLHSPDIRALVGTLHGMKSTPTPPSGDGAYDLTIVFFR